MTAPERDPRSLLRRVRDELTAEVLHLPPREQVLLLESRPAVAELLDVLAADDTDGLLVVKNPGGVDDADLGRLAEALGDDIVIARVPAPRPEGPAVWRTPWGRIEAVEPPSTGESDGAVLLEQHLRTVPLTANAARELALTLFAAAQHLEIVAVEAVNG